MHSPSPRVIAALLAATALVGGCQAMAPPETSPARPTRTPGPTSAGEAITVTAIEYAFQGVPTTVPTGTAFSLVNAGSEVHELTLIRKNAGVTESFEELLALPEARARELMTFVGGFTADPGPSRHSAPVTAPEPGDYLMICFIPQGTTSTGQPIDSPAPSIPVGPPHFLLGMQQEFEVTDAGS